MRKSIEDAVIAALADLQLPGRGGAAGGYLCSVQPFAGDFARPDPTDIELTQLMHGGAPCVGVGTGDGNYSDIRTARLDAELGLTIEMIVVSTNARGAEERNRGDGGLGTDPGIYQIIEDIRARLFSPDLGVAGAGGATPVRESPAVRTAEITVWHLVYEIEADVVQADPAANDPDLTTIRTNVNNQSDPAADPIVQGDVDLEVPT